MNIDELLDLREKTGGLHRLMGIDRIELDEQGRVHVSLEIRDDLLNIHGKAHGGTIFTLCDVAVGCQVALTEKQSVTLDSSIQYYRPGAAGSVLTAIVNLRKNGRKVSSYFVEVYDEKNIHIADAIFSMYHAG